jgi:hypothetical protein
MDRSTGDSCPVGGARLADHGDAVADHGDAVADEGEARGLLEWEPVFL